MHVSWAMRGNCFNWEIENFPSPEGTGGPACTCPGLPSPAHSPGPHVSPCPRDATAELVSSSPQPCLAMCPNKPGPHPGDGAAQGDPKAPSLQGAAFFCSLILQVCLSSPAWLSSSLGCYSEDTHSLAAQTRVKWLQSQKRQGGRNLQVPEVALQP